MKCIEWLSVVSTVDRMKPDRSYYPRTWIALRSSRLVRLDLSVRRNPGTAQS